MLALAYFMRTHWFFVFVQILGLYAAGVACIWILMHIFSWRNIVENFCLFSTLELCFLSGNSGHKIHTAN